MPNVEIPDDIQKLCSIVDELWETCQNQTEFESYASADYDAVYQALHSLSHRHQTMLELGSGLGVVTIMASRLGFEAYGIEAKQGLVNYSREFANSYAPQATFGVGSFIPDQFEWDPSHGDESVRTFVDLPDAYNGLGMGLDEFDLIYAYPWPTEHELYRNFLNQFARPGAQFLTYDAREGIQVTVI